VTERDVTVTLATGAGETTTATGRLKLFNPGDRLRRALTTLGIGFLCAALLIPIPIIHLLGIPLAIVASIVISIRQFSSAARLDPLRMPCPKCNAINRVGGGLGIRHPELPVERNCDSCRRPLQLRITDR
jgi:hypothetical protein